MTARPFEVFRTVIAFAVRFVTSIPAIVTVFFAGTRTSDARPVAIGSGTYESGQKSLGPASRSAIPKKSQRLPRIQCVCAWACWCASVSSGAPSPFGLKLWPQPHVDHLFGLLTTNPLPATLSV